MKDITTALLMLAGVAAYCLLAVVLLAAITGCEQAPDVNVFSAVTPVAYEYTVELSEDMQIYGREIKSWYIELPDEYEHARITVMVKHWQAGAIPDNWWLWSRNKCTLIITQDPTGKVPDNRYTVIVQGSAGKIVHQQGEVVSY